MAQSFGAMLGNQAPPTVLEKAQWRASCTVESADSVCRHFARQVPHHDVGAASHDGVARHQDARGIEHYRGFGDVRNRTPKIKDLCCCSLLLQIASSIQFE